MINEKGRVLLDVEAISNVADLKNSIKLMKVIVDLEIDIVDVLNKDKLGLIYFDLSNGVCKDTDTCIDYIENQVLEAKHLVNHIYRDLKKFQENYFDDRGSAYIKVDEIGKTFLVELDIDKKKKLEEMISNVYRSKVDCNSIFRKRSKA